MTSAEYKDLLVKLDLSELGEFIQYQDRLLV